MVNVQIWEVPNQNNHKVKYVLVLMKAILHP